MRTISPVGELNQRKYEEQSRAFVRWVLLGCAVLSLVVVLALIYVSVLSAVLFAVSGGILGAMLAIAKMPEQPPRTINEQLAILDQVWEQEVPASQAAMVQAYLEDPDGAVRALVGNRTSISVDAAREFLASRVTG